MKVLGVAVLASVILGGMVTGVFGVVTVQVPDAVQVGSPPPVAVAVFWLVVALAATATGTRTTMVPFEAPDAIEQPVRLLPVAGQPLRAPLLVLDACLVGAPVRVMPAGKASAKVSAAVVGPLATVTVMS